MTGIGQDLAYSGEAHRGLRKAISMRRYSKQQIDAAATAMVRPMVCVHGVGNARKIVQEMGRILRAMQEKRKEVDEHESRAGKK